MIKVEKWIWRRLLRGYRLSHYLIRRHCMRGRLGWRYVLLPLALSYYINFTFFLKTVSGLRK